MSIKIVAKSSAEILRAKGLGQGGDAQKHLDSEVLRLCEHYVPWRGGDLRASGPDNTIIGSGRIIYNTPYAAKQYDENAGLGREGREVGGKRGKKWFEKMKEEEGDCLLRETANFLRTKGK